ncbi:MAG: hypothetical protein ACOZNI_02535 [Myxococcota bacterium]
MSSLPPRLAAWLRPRVAEPPRERLATCHACAMCAAPGEPSTPRHFRPDVKCCTWHPTLPNFAVGAILRDPASPGRDVLRRKIEEGVGVTPRGVGPPQHWEMLYARAPFGRTRAMVCPYFADGACGVWRHREAVCATYFCKHEDGPAGERWWTSAKRFLSAVEDDLASWCVTELDPGPEPRARIAAAPPDGELPPWDFEGPLPRAELEARFGRWADRVEAFFEACADLVDGIDPERVLERCGPEARLAARNLTDEEHARKVT